MKVLSFVKRDYVSIINYIIIAYAFCLPLSRAGISMFTTLMFLFWLLQADFVSKINLIKKEKVILSFSLFIILSFLSLFWTEFSNIKDGFSDALKLLRLILLPMIVIVTTLKQEYVKKVILSFLLGMFISEVLSYGIFFELWILPFGSGTPTDPTPVMHRLDYGVFLAFTSLILLNRLFFIEYKKFVYVYALYFIFVIASLFINGGRVGYLSFTLSLFVAGFLNIKKRLIAGISILAFVTVVFSIAYNYSPVFKTRIGHASAEIEKIINRNPSLYNGSFGVRLGMWQTGLEIFKDEPILGVGFGSQREKLKEYSSFDENIKRSFVKNFGSFHNQYMEILVRVGLLGVFLYFLIWYYIYKLKIKNKEMSNLRYIFIAVFSIGSLVENIFGNQFPMSLFALFISLFIVSSTCTENKAIST